MRPEEIERIKRMQSEEIHETFSDRIAVEEPEQRETK